VFQQDLQDSYKEVAPFLLPTSDHHNTQTHSTLTLISKHHTLSIKMHFNTLTTATTMVAILAQTSEANIGQGAGLLGRIFSEIGSGAWGVGVEVATKKAKRNGPYISKRVPQNTSPYPGVSDVEYNRCFDELTSTRVEVTSPASDGMIELHSKYAWLCC
jgi:hypothetical protein